MQKKKFIFVAVIILVFGLLTYQGIKGEGPSLDFPLHPLRLIEKGATAVISRLEHLIHSYILIVGKEDENRKLMKKVRAFEQEITRFAEANLENERLRKLLQMKTERPDYITSADVFGRDATNWFKMLWINKGARDGIARDMVAVTPVGPIGRIYRVSDTSAQVLLITDVNSSIAVRLQQSRAEGILEGKGDTGCYLKYISKDAEIREGEKILTSGLDGIYPKGLLIAHVSDIDKQGGEMFQQIEAVPAQDLSTVEEVAILKK